MTLTWLPKIRACHLRVAYTRNAEILVAHLLVPVYQGTLDLHRPVDQNVVSTPIVPWILFARTRNAEILVKDLVALHPYARFTITCQYALVPNNTLVILSAIVILLLDQVRNLKKLKTCKRFAKNHTFIRFTAEPTVVDPCASSPCGPNAQCNDGVCTCLAEYQGDPYIGCRPECVLNTDCPQNRACVRNKCVNPCPGICGRNAECLVYNHIPMCTCPSGMIGNAFVQCIVLQGIIFHIKNTKLKIFLSIFIQKIEEFMPLKMMISSAASSNDFFSLTKDHYFQSYSSSKFS